VGGKARYALLAYYEEEEWKTKPIVLDPFCEREFEEQPVIYKNPTK
jgi:hypothetical protein